MGMLLFDKSGTFVPSDYGLTAGDMLHIVAVGGGGSAGAAGGATSFGNLLTVAGGAAAGSFGYGGEGFIRCCYATDINRIKVAMERLACLVKEKTGR